MPIQREIVHQSLQLGVFLTELPKFPQFTQPQPRIVPLPHIARLLGDPHLPADLRHGRATFRLPQGGQDLLVGMSSSSYLRQVLLGEKKTTSQVRSSSVPWSTFWVLGQRAEDSQGRWSNYKGQVTLGITNVDRLRYCPDPIIIHCDRCISCPSPLTLRPWPIFS